jgi:hypothetical protein
MANPWSQLAPGIQTSLQPKLLNSTIRSSFTGANRHFIKRDVPSFRSFGEWYDEYYRNQAQPAVDEAHVFAEWFFNYGLSQRERNSLLCVQAKLKAEQLWEVVATIYWVGPTGEILFVPAQPVDALRRFLGSRGYGDWWMASRKGPWGMRSRFRGAQLHFYGPNDKPLLVNVHIDLNNPGDPTTTGAKPTGALEELGQALHHLDRDEINRNTTHTPAQLRAGLAATGLRVASVP